MHNKLLIIMFILILVVGSSLLVFLPKKGYSEDENRFLAKLPETTLERIQSGKWMEDVETYIDDHFPFRLKWIGLKTNVELFFGKIESNGVYLTDSGYYIEKFTKYDEEQLQKNRLEVIQFSQRMKERYGITVNVLLAPTASTILNHLLTEHNYELNQMELIKHWKDDSFEMIEVGESLLKEKDKYIYYYSDHHWTSLGAFIAYQTWKPNTKSIEEYKHEVLSEDFLGTLYSKVKVKPPLKDTMDAFYLSEKQEVEYNLLGIVNPSFYEKTYLNKKDKYSVYFNGNQGVTKIKGYGEQGNLLIIKDSYANTFAQFPTADFNEVHLIDLRNSSISIDEYIENENITTILILYNVVNFTQDKHLFLLNKKT